MKILTTLVIVTLLNIVSVYAGNTRFGSSGETSTYTGDKTINGSITTTGDISNDTFEAAASSGVAVGSGGARSFTDGDGDLYVEDELEVDGTVWLNKGIVQFYNSGNGFIGPGGASEATLKAFSPGGAGRLYYDNTNKAVIISTGTGTGAFGLITDGTSSPTGW